MTGSINDCENSSTPVAIEAIPRAVVGLAQAYERNAQLISDQALWPSELADLRSEHLLDYRLFRLVAKAGMPEQLRTAPALTECLEALAVRLAQEYGLQVSLGCYALLGWAVALGLDCRPALAKFGSWDRLRQVILTSPTGSLEELSAQLSHQVLNASAKETSLGSVSCISGISTLEQNQPPTEVIAAPELQLVEFGRYPQSYASCSEPLEWQVLETKPGYKLLITRLGIDAKPYHHAEVPITWELSDLRYWLNVDFYRQAFSKEEQSRLVLASITNASNPWSGTAAGNDTFDRVFLLSINECSQYFRHRRERALQPTPYAISQGAYTDADNTGKYWAGKCSWWLRSPGMKASDAGFVHCDGEIVSFDYINWPSGVVRPAVWLKTE